MPLTAFSDLPLPSSLLEALDLLGFASMLPVQAQSLPAILAGRDVLVQADTGSGKTLAFGLGMLAKLESRLDVQALCLCPTRELCDQVSTELRRLASRTPNVKILTLCGGVPFAPQRASLKQGAHVVIGTPGRIEEHLRKGSVSFAQLEVLVLDEADRMLDMGFEPQIAQVLQHVPAKRQTLLFSATYRDTITELSRRYQDNSERISVESSAAELAQASASGEAAQPGIVQQRFFRVSEQGRVSALVRWLSVERPESALVFCNTKVECAEVSLALCASGWAAASIHGDLAQRERQHVMRLFANGSCSVLAATDVAARGWDIPDLPVVVNLGLSRDPIQHVHRQGRTGRLGRAGLVVSFVAESDGFALGAIERAQRQSVTFEQLPAGHARLPAAPRPPRITLILSAGKNKKLRPGDILGALTADGDIPGSGIPGSGIPGSDVGMIQIDDSTAYVAIAARSAERACLRLNEAGVKGRSVKARIAGLELRESSP